MRGGRQKVRRHMLQSTRPGYSGTAFHSSCSFVIIVRSVRWKDQLPILSRLSYVGRDTRPASLFAPSSLRDTVMQQSTEEPNKGISKLYTIFMSGVFHHHLAAPLWQRQIPSSSSSGAKIYYLSCYAARPYCCRPIKFLDIDLNGTQSIDK